MNNKFNYYISPSLDNNFYNWIIEFIIETIGLVPVNQKSIDEKTNLIYGETYENEKSELINIPHHSSDLIEESILNYQADKNILNEFDIITAIGKFLIDEVNENKKADCYDIHNRLNSLDSFQREINYQDQPIVNLYINFLEKIFKQLFSFEYTSLLPNGKKSVIILSHDVDDPMKYAILNSYKLCPKNLSFKNCILYHLEGLKKATKRFIKKDEQEFWLFNDVMNSESKYGFKSTFFFAARNRFDKHANFKHDVPYDISNQEFLSLFKEMKQRGFEIGLHASYLANNKSEILKEEVEKLEKFTNAKPLGNRHHFWQIGPKPEKTLQSHTEAGLLYDSSLAFNDAPGYRRSVALPYFIFDKERNIKVENLQIPTFMMDSNFMLNPEFEQHEAFNHAKHYIDQFHKIGGVAAIDWHVRTSSVKSNRFKKWGEVYLKILEHLSNKQGIWVTNFETFYNWTKERKNALYKTSL